MFLVMFLHRFEIEGKRGTELEGLSQLLLCLILSGDSVKFWS